MRPGRLDGPTLRGALWAIRSLFAVRLQLRRRGMEGVRVQPPASLPDAAERGVKAVLRRTRFTCLVESYVRQAWFASRGRDVEIIVGTTGPGSKFAAHAWLDGDPNGWQRYHELTRIPPRT